MPANLTPDYKEAELRYKRARDDDERLNALLEMLALIPKHKGTEKLQADIKTRISKLRKQSGPKTSGAHRSTWYQIDKQGAGQVVLFGSPNTGKSSIVAALTGAQTTVAAYPFSTVAPQAGMMPFEDIQVQLIDTPPIYEDTEPWVFHFLRVCDLALMVIDLDDDDIIVAVEKLQSLLQARNIRLGPDPADGARPCLVVGCKCDADGAAERQAIAAELLGAGRPILPVSATTGQGLEDLRARIFQGLHVVRVYTKRPGHPVEMKDPLILPAGSTVLAAAQHLHKDFAAQLRYAKYWDGDKIAGLMVERSHVIQDRAVIEFHI
jgi:ribosome-interacting GTPase 1